MSLRVCLFIFAGLPITAMLALGAVIEPVVSDAIPDQYRPLIFDQQRLSGLFANRMRANVEGYLKPRVKRNFSQSDAGEYLDAAAHSYAYDRDKNLGAAMHTALKIALRPPSKDAGNISRHLIGLLSYYRTTGNQAAFQECKKLGDAVVGLPADDDALEAMVKLYRFTGDERYLNYCKRSAELLLRSPDEDLDDSTDRLISGSIGLAELYRVTRDVAAFKFATNTWNHFYEHRLTATGTLEASASDSKAICRTFSWMQLTLELFRLTGHSKYGDALERAAYNQLLAEQDNKTGDVYTTVPLNGSRETTTTGDCKGRVPQGIATIPSLIWGRYGKGIAINLYSPGSATVTLHRRRDVRFSGGIGSVRVYRGTVRLYEETNFPESGNVLLHVEPDHDVRFPLRLRVPSWTDSFTASIRKTHLTGKPGQFLVINRRWKRGDTVNISMGMTVKLVHPSPSASKFISLQRGPQILSLGKELNPEISNLSRVRLAIPDESRPTVTNLGDPMPAGRPSDQAYRIEGAAQQPLVFVPFADATVYRTSFPAQR